MNLTRDQAIAESYRWIAAIFDPDNLDNSHAEAILEIAASMAFDSGE